METRLDPHRFELMYKSIMKAIEKSDLSEKNKKLIFRFRDDCIRDGLSKARITKLLGCVRNMVLEFDKELNKVTKKDIERFILKLQQKEFSPWTKHSYKVILKKFFNLVEKLKNINKEAKIAGIEAINNFVVKS